MSQSKTPKKLNQTERRLLFLAVLLCLGLTTTWLLFNPNNMLTYYNLKKELETVQTKNAQLKDENEKLRLKIEKIQSDPSYLEEIARKDYDLLKKNEVVFEFK